MFNPTTDSKEVKVNDLKEKDKMVTATSRPTMLCATS